MSWSAAEERLAQSLPGYESRENQTALARTIEHALAERQHLFAQAGCGTGKSFAAMIPAIEHAVATGLPVVVSTATKSLQAQYINSDVPFLRANLGIEFDATVLKGRGSYACLQKIRELSPGEVTGQASLVEELESQDHTGDLDDLVTMIDFRDKPKITSSSDECPGKRDCPLGEVCFAEQAKSRAQRAQLIIVNHALLITDLMLKAAHGQGILPEYCAVVVDEAHELEEYATGALGSEFVERGLTNLASETGNFFSGQHTQDVSALTGAAKKLFLAMSRFLGTDKTRSLDEAAVLEHSTVLIATLDALRSLRDSVVAETVHGDDRRAQARKRLMKRLDSMVVKFSAILLADSADMVRWVETDPKRGTILKFAPLHVGSFLATHLWEQVPAVLMSATLAVGSDFSYLAGRLGVVDYASFDAGTPFNYPKQAALYIPAGFNPSAGLEWRTKVAATLTELARAADGRALFLFTSTTAMREAHAAVSPALEDLGHRVLMQGEQTNRVLAETFKADATSVLFALKSFMTGFDVQGDSLRLVVMDKLPFAVPTDVIVKARADAIDAAARNKWVDGSFPTMAVPSMALTLMQAFGRLIRTKDDEGLVAILDSRVHPDQGKAYGRKIYNALPPARRVNTLQEAKSYLEELGVRRANM